MGGSPADNDWYTSLNKAPWTPPGWVFGFAWTTIMILYSIYLSRVFKSLPNEKLKLAVVLFLDNGFLMSVGIQFSLYIMHWCWAVFLFFRFLRF